MVETQKIISGQATCRDIVKCMYGLSDFELAIYKRLVKHGRQRADDLAPLMKKDRSTVYRALQRLVGAGMAFRETRSIDRGGYYHVYTAIGPEQLRDKLRGCADDWFDNIKAAIDDFDLV